MAANKQNKNAHPLVRLASAGQLPKWAVAGAARRAHIKRVTKLMDVWSAELDLSKSNRMRWRAAGMLHDALRDASGKVLRPIVANRFKMLPDSILHGPAAARRLEQEGVRDKALVRAVRFHSLGHRKLDNLGRALCVADFVEPGRSRLRGWRDDLLLRMPGDVDGVLQEIFAARVELMKERQEELPKWTAAFWKSLAASAKK